MYIFSVVLCFPAFLNAFNIRTAINFSLFHENSLLIWIPKHLCYLAFFSYYLCFILHLYFVFCIFVYYMLFCLRFAPCSICKIFRWMFVVTLVSWQLIAFYQSKILPALGETYLYWSAERLLVICFSSSFFFSRTRFTQLAQLIGRKNWFCETNNQTFFIVSILYYGWHEFTSSISIFFNIKDDCHFLYLLLISKNFTINFTTMRNNTDLCCFISQFSSMFCCSDMCFASVSLLFCPSYCLLLSLLLFTPSVWTIRENCEMKLGIVLF